jgi:hypothetical protein
VPQRTTSGHVSSSSEATLLALYSVFSTRSTRTVWEGVPCFAETSSSTASQIILCQRSPTHTTATRSPSPPPRSLPLPQDVIAPAKTATLNRNGAMASSAFRPWAPQNEAEDEVDLMPCTLCHKWSRVHSAGNDHSSHTGLCGLFRCGACTAVKGVGPAVRVEGQLGGFVGNVLTSRHHRNGTLCWLHTVTTTCNDTTLPPPPARARAHAHDTHTELTHAQHAPHWALAACTCRGRCCVESTWTSRVCGPDD